MNTFIRWWKFNLVGGMGMVAQLATLALLDRWPTGHHLYAAAVAVELALLHNFVWHLHYTWRDRREASPVLSQFIRFHLSNGLISMAGNLVLMKILIDETRLSPIASNVVAILCCSLVSFCLCDRWGFVAGEKAA